MSKAFRLTREELHARGWKLSNGEGGLVPAGRADDFDNGGGEGPAGCVIRGRKPGKIDGYSLATPSGGSDLAARDTAPPSGNQAPPVVNSRPQIRVPRRRVPNRTENLYQGEARRRWPECELRYEAFAFILPSGCRYVPDWTVWDGATLVAVVEVKGGYLHPNSTRSIHAWKEAAAAWQAVRFVFAQWKDGAWNETEILPKQ